VNDRRPQGLGRLGAAWRELGREQRRAAFAALGLFIAMLLPWYQKSVPGKKSFRPDNLNAFGAFSFVEAAVLLVAAGVLFMLFARGERRAFHLPGGDGTIIFVAGAWAAILIIWRFFDKPGVGGGVTIGLQWGIFVALVAAGILAWTGARLRAAHRPEPPLRARRPEPPPGEPVDVHIPDERPHLEETKVMPGRDEPPTEPQPPPGRAGDQPQLPGMG
jgi:hypothetical protein